MAKSDKFGPDGAITGGKHGGDMHEGMKYRGCHDGEHGVSPGGHNINKEATRDSTAPTPGTLGPRRI